MGNTKEKKGITLLALVITIVIMLLLAGIVIQMTMGENGLIAKSEQAQKAQAKAELYETAKLSYINLKAKATENGEPSPQAELALSTIEFTNKYNVVGDNVTDKKGNVIDTKENLINALKMLYPQQETSKNIGGVEILPSDKDKLIIKVKVHTQTTMQFGRMEGISYSKNTDPVKIEYEDGTEEMTDLYSGNSKEYSPGDYIIKFSGISNYIIRGDGEYRIEILNWGKFENIEEENIINISNVSKIYEPEPDRVPIHYIAPKFKEIPEWIFSKKVTSKVMSGFYGWDIGSGGSEIEIIPENLFRNCINAENFNRTFLECKKIKSIPENLFKYNTKAKKFENTFAVCEGLEEIPKELFKYNTETLAFDSTFRGCKKLKEISEELFKYNINMTEFSSTFSDCVGLTSIPEGLFKNNINVTSFESTFSSSGITNIPIRLFENNVNVSSFKSTFMDCIGLTSIPEGLFKNNVKVTSFESIFRWSRITSIPEDLFKNNVNVSSFKSTFMDCTSLTSIPEGLFKNNLNVTNFESTFSRSTIINIPGGLFENNINVTNFSSTFLQCTGLMSIPETIIEYGKKVKEKGGDTHAMFRWCESASNYASIPNYMK